MNHSNELYLGLISGTSVDCIDAVIVNFAEDRIKLLTSHSHPIPDTIQSALYRLMTPGDNEIDRMGQLDQQLGELFAEAALSVLQKADIAPAYVKAIGSHGQTIRHRPAGQLERAFTLQIADPNQIVEKTGITTIADFRRRDMAAKGQGAPLVPAFHRAAFADTTIERVIVNIGGISNITHLCDEKPVFGFDTGPGNALMDEWHSRHQQRGYDANGAWARTGNINERLLSKLLSHPYFGMPAPKSTGREIFTLSWVDETLSKDNLGKSITSEDVQRTLLELTARCVQQHIIDTVVTPNFEVYICGGGAHNWFLMERLQALLSANKVDSTAGLGIEPDWVEAMAFAWLAKQTMSHQPGNVPSVTGALGDRILGGIYYA